MAEKGGKSEKAFLMSADNQCVSLLSTWWQDGQPDILYTFWNDVTSTLSEEFHRATEGKTSPFPPPQSPVQLPA